MPSLADPYEMTILLENLEKHWVVSCIGRSKDEKGGKNRSKYGFPMIPPEKNAPCIPQNRVRELVKVSTRREGYRRRITDGLHVRRDQASVFKSPGALVEFLLRRFDRLRPGEQVECGQGH